MSWEWEPFFIGMAQVTATTFVVLLATLQLGRKRWTGAELKSVAAIRALLQLLIPLIASLVALMPGHPWRVGYVVMGTAGIGGLIWHARIYLRCEDAADEFDDRQIRWGLPVSLCVYISVIAFSFGDESRSLFVVAALSLWLLVSGPGEAWLLLSDTPPGARMNGRPSGEATGGVPQSDSHRRADSARAEGAVPPV